MIRLMSFTAFVALTLNTSCGSELMVSKAGKKQNAERQVTRLVPNVAQPGQFVTAYGTGFSKTTRLSIGGLNIPFTLKDSSSIDFVLPKGQADGLIPINFEMGVSDTETVNIIQGSEAASLALSELSASEICKGLPFQNKEGLIKEGEQNCESTVIVTTDVTCTSDGQTDCLTSANFPAVDKKIELIAHASIIRDSVTIAGVTGTLKQCLDSDSSCYVPPFVTATSPLRTFDMRTLLPTVLKSGSMLLGVNGTLLPRPADCSQDGELDCVASAAYPAAQNSNIIGTNYTSDLTIANIPGTIADCSANATGCFVKSYVAATQPLKAIDATPLTEDVLLYGSVIGGVTGALVVTPADCSHNGDTACITISAYPAVIKSDITAAKVHSSLTLATTVGTQHDCAADGSVGCFAVTNYPSIQKSLIAAAKIKTGVTLGGVAGTLANCTNNGSNCFVEAYAATTSPLKAIDYSPLAVNVIKSGSSIAGISGSVVMKPSDCAIDGATGCVATTVFPSLNKLTLDGQVANIHSSVTIANVTGTLTSCNADNQTNCYAIANFPAVDKSVVSASPGKFFHTFTLAGVSGTLNDCATDGGSNCLTVSAFPSIDHADIVAKQSKFLSSLSIAGLSGTVGTCVANASDCYIPTYAAGTQNLKAISYDSIVAGNLKSGSSLSGIAGTMIPKPSDCSVDAETNCVAISTFPAVDKDLANTNRALVRIGLTLGGIAGTMLDCSADGQAGCYAMIDYPAINAGFVDTNKAKIFSGISVGGVTGTLAACTSIGSNCVLPPFAAITQPLKAINFDDIAANIIKSGSTIAGIGGSVIASDPPCSVDGGTSCVTTTNFPASDHNAIDTDKAKVLSTLSIGGVTGTLQNCGSTSEADCYATSAFPAYNKNTTETNLAKIHSSVTIGAATGTMTNCAANASGCFIPSYVTTTQPLKAINFESITSDIIKNGTTVGGISGDYPSSTHPLSVGDSNDDLDSTLFNSQLTLGSTYGWFDRYGVRHTQAGDADIASSSIVSGIDILGVSGSISATINAWDVRAGKSYGNGGMGKLRMNCRNLVDRSQYDVELPKYASTNATNDTISAAGNDFADGDALRLYYNGGATANIDVTAVFYVLNHTFASGTETFQITLTQGSSTPFDITVDTTQSAVAKVAGTGKMFSTIDNGKNTAFPTLNPWAIGSQASCLGVEVTDGDDGLWKDVTNGGCTAGAECRFMDKVTKLQWSKPMPSTLNYYDSTAKCNDLTWDGDTHWRLPTQFEIQMAGVHGFASATSANWVTLAESGNDYSTSTTRNSTITNTLYSVPSFSYSNVAAKTGVYHVICVHE